MKSYLQNLPPRVWYILALPALALAYSMITVVGPAVIHAILPESVRAVLGIM
jgi:hypothetical protein